jgi:hypothetical protein
VGFHHYGNPPQYWSVPPTNGQHLPGRSLGALHALQGAHHPAHTFQDPNDPNQGGPQRGHLGQPDYSAIIERLRSLLTHPDNIELLKHVVSQRFGS